MSVLGGNRLGRALKGKQVTVLVVEGTKFRKNGKAALADIVTGDRLNVQGRALQARLAGHDARRQARRRPLPLG